MDRIQLFLAIFATLASNGVYSEGEMKLVLDGMQQMMEGPDSGTFDEDFFADLTQCFGKFDPQLMEAQDKAWAGMMEYAASGGQPSDEWLSCQEIEDQGLTAEDVGNGWYEFNCTVQELGGLSIYEPCYYASNMAYYHTLVELCLYNDWRVGDNYVLSMIQNFAFLGFGSAFFHGSVTGVGGSCDVKLNDLFTFLAYQAATSELEPLDSKVIHDLSVDGRAKSVFEITAQLEEMFLTRPVEEWEEEIDALDVPPIVEGMCAFFATGLSLFLEGEELTQATEFFLELIGVTEDAEFCLENFLPEIEAATESIELSEAEKEELKGAMVGTVIKLLYAFLWQEEFLVTPLLFSDLGNRLGYELLPMVNALGNSFLPEEGFPHYDPDLQEGINVYPGEEWCDPTALPHAKWHLQTGIALADFMHLADLLHLHLSPTEDKEGGGATAISGGKEHVGVALSTTLALTAWSNISF